MCGSSKNLSYLLKVTSSFHYSLFSRRCGILRVARTLKLCSWQNGNVSINNAVCFSSKSYINGHKAFVTTEKLSPILSHKNVANNDTYKGSVTTHLLHFGMRLASFDVL